ncbi:hypothetical protein [Deinococcus planocerae]|uniref:hypothetical protein n=1 Tax=Deinococcus planocerae TaxID=1737569 RepID=UPI000C7F62C1|nr:hypothetical protein [Deinococcus planocerae]
MKTRLLPLAAALLAPSAGALTVTGSVAGNVSPETRVSVWAVSASGQPVQEIASVPVTSGGRFRLDLPGNAPAPRALTPLSAQNVSWPGVLDPVTVSAPAQAAELKFFTYRDANRNGTRDEGETLNEATANVGRGTLFVVWVGGDVTVKANRGYEAALKRGWNALVVEVARAVKVAPYADGSAEVTLQAGR